MKYDKQSGFTMIELMIAVAVVAILVAIVYPGYQGYIVRAHRAVGEGSLLEIASRQEQYFATNSTYANALGLLGYTDTYYVDREGDGTSSTNGIYQISVTVEAGAPFTTYQLTATRRNYQTRDDDCGDLGLSHRGEKTSTIAGTHCW